jgi:hypothetical protein
MGELGMSKYKVLLYFSFAAFYATVDEVPNGETLLFDSLEEAERYGRSKSVPFEAEVK